MLEKILPQNILLAVRKHVAMDKLFEIRMRVSSPVVLNYGGIFCFFGEDGPTNNPSNAFFCDRKGLEGIVLKASDYSMYAVNDQIKQGFLTIKGGIRIGICGEVVEEFGVVKTLKNFSSLNIRIPHEVVGCGLSALGFMLSPMLNNTLIISPPGAGKTTVLRDLARLLSQHELIQSVMVLDERGEIAACSDGLPLLDVGQNTDVMSFCSKKFGFEQGVRAMRPDVIITDELSGADDIAAAALAISSGIKIIASTHAFDHLDLSLKPDFDFAIKKRLFGRFVVLSNRRGPGTYEGVYDENFNCLYYP